MNMFSSPIEATHVGTLKIGTYFINPVYHVSNGCANILLASQLIDHGLKPHFKTDQFLFKGSDKIAATFPRIGRLFLAPISDYICVVNMKIPENFDWHYALDTLWINMLIFHQVIVSRDYVVPNIEVDAGSSVLDV
ncbi:hypothetical protein H4Q26_013277 [Puccinia striiformis f. sp. tritici PST-130]|nr:hypothetical protein H4Q26_013277 [Puccinia striiformis f. sp. tritici PST-130]